MGETTPPPQKCPALLAVLVEGGSGSVRREEEEGGDWLIGCGGAGRWLSSFSTPPSRVVSKHMKLRADICFTYSAHYQLPNTASRI